MRCASFLFLFICALFVTACTPFSSATSHTASFQLYSGNGALPPEYQRTTIIRGTIEPSQIALVYTFRDKNGQIERPLTLKGDLYQKYIAMIQQTRITEIPAAERPIGGSVFDVTLTDEQGQSVVGTPSNRQAWIEFAQAVAHAVDAPAEVR